ncbi:ArnT family glycosyltransferase [Actinomadura algeriensis]|uniref:4-amino-4-deoxy-L-arabinose transferase-like glycosyltransferase n=1 Tax=Actinomadura algeriensis TaxID=1679523 RepID=A0ABR9JJ77_9ACTN|nr:glycosyltransferase family 39 protein [Actinomadura algeriensis]MBE1530478.1 4-amino-4-deoxy-L-arabinose transferase-like glycosyltransferase [Actinomadura algeriensis]
MTSTLPGAPPGPTATARRDGLARRLLRGPGADPAWARPALLVLLAATAVLYLWGLGASGWANSFYSAAVQAGATSWSAFFFGASDAAGAITVDKPPGALWPMALAARVFGVNAWSILVPQALMGVATVGTLYAAVHRRFPAWAGLLAGAALALTPVAALMFRFNNPDALLVLLLTLGAYGVVRAQESASTRWLVFAAACVGTGFLAKMLQAFLVVPVFALVYLVAAPTPVRRRLWQLVLAGVALLVSAGWWVAIVAVVPASSRPYIGGSQHDSVLELALGYNGLGRLNGDETGGLGNTNQDAGWGRMFGSVIGGQVSWLLPAALVLLAAGLWATRRAPRTDPARAALALWGGWLLLTAVIFSHMQGIFHEYYTVALAPAIAALVGIGAALLWERRRTAWASTVLAVAVAVTAVWAQVLLDRSASWNAWLGPVVAGAGLLAAAAIAAHRLLRGRTLAAALVLAVVAGLAGPAAYAVETVRTPHSGAIVTAGPSTSGGFGPGPGGGRPGGRAGGGRPGGGGPGFAAPPGTGQGQAPGAAPSGRRDGGGPGGGARPGGGPGGGGGGPGGLLNAGTPDAEVVAALKADAASYTWVAAAVGSNSAAGPQLATGEPVMAIGGFNGTDPAPTLAQFQELVRQGKIHYFIGGGSGGMRGGASGSDAARRISEWVAATYTATEIGGTTLYDLTKT